MIVCLPQALCCSAVMLSVTPLRPEPCSQWNQLWNWQVCLLHSPTTLFFFSSFFLFSLTHTHKCNYIQTQKRSLLHGLRFRYTCTHTHTPLPLHLPTSTHIHRQSHKLQAASLMPATNTEQKEYAHRAPSYGGYSLNTYLRFDQNSQNYCICTLKPCLKHI